MANPEMKVEYKAKAEEEKAACNEAVAVSFMHWISTR